MKRFLCLMGMLCAISNLYKTKLSAMLAVTTLFMCLIAAIKAPAQTGAAATMDEIQPLQIGDTIPEELWHLPLQVVNHPEEKKTITLNDYRGKLIILDFWGTFCTSCIAAMPKIKEIEKQFSDGMVVIPVSWSKPETTEATLLTHRTLAPLALLSVVEAKALIDIFPHGVVPHYAWIGMQGKVIATTATDDVTADNIVKVLRGEEPSYTYKTYVDMEIPLLMDSQTISEGMTVRKYSVIVEGEIVSLGSATRFRKYDNEIHGVVYINRRMLNIYQSVLQKTHPSIRSKQVVWVDKQTDKNIYTVDFILPPEHSRSLYGDLLDYLDVYSGYSGKWVTRRQLCWLLKNNDRNNLFVSQSTAKKRQLHGDTFMLNGFPIEHLISKLESMPVSEDRIVLNETGYEGAVDIVLHGPFDQLDHIRGQLRKQGLDLVLEEREIDIFEIRKND